MPKEKWLIDPGEFDEFQRKIAGISINDSYIIKGSAGSGKTLLALYRARDIRIKALAEGEDFSSFTLVVFTKSLRSFITSAVLDLGIELRQIIHYEKWDGGQVDYIIVDEAQDFNKDEIDILAAAKTKSIMLYGDTQQQIYSGRLNIEEISGHLGIPEKELFNNYRLPKSIASFASNISGDTSLETFCLRSGTEKPKIIKFKNWQEELDFIINEIKVRNYSDVALLLPFNNKSKAPHRNAHRNVEVVKEYLDSKEFSHEFKMREEDHDNMELDFDSDLLKVMPFHSAKGLQFETVFIPFCDYPCHDKWFVENYKKPLYVALTRSYKNLYLTHTGTLTPFFNKIPTSQYEKIGW